MTEPKTRRIRDFVYIDQDRLYSFYSQLNKGVAQQIFQSVVHGESATSSQTNPELKDEIAESERSRALERTESSILYDYMYEQLENQLADSIIDVSEILPEKTLEEMTSEDLQYYFNSITSAFMIKVTGNTEFEDYERMDAFLEDSNRLMKTFAHFITLSNENVAAIKALNDELERERDRNRKAQIKEQIKKLQSADAIAEEKKLLDDPVLIKNLRFLLDVFYKKGFHIAVTSTTPPFAAFRAIVNRKWLRIEPELLRSLYPGMIESSWTLVGQVTSKSMQGLNSFQSFNELFEKYMSSAKSLRDPMRYVFNRVRSLDALLNQNGIRFEPIVCPLAIYRELPLPQTSSTPGDS